MSVGLGMTGISARFVFRLTRDADDPAQCGLGNSVDDVPNMLKLTPLNATQLHAVARKPVTGRTGCADGQHEVVPVTLMQVPVKLDDERRLLHRGLTN